MTITPNYPTNKPVGYTLDLTPEEYHDLLACMEAVEQLDQPTFTSSKMRTIRGDAVTYSRANLFSDFQEARKAFEGV